MSPTSNPPRTSPETLQGAPATRVDGPAKVTGSALYSADNNVTGLAYGYLVLSSIASGTVREMQVQAAEQSPGVLGVFTPFRPLPYAGPMPGSIFGPSRFPLQPNDLEVRHHGQVIAMVVAESFEQARDAAALIETTYDSRPPNTSFEDGIPNAVVPPPGFGGQPTVDRLEPGVGSIDEALAGSEVRVSGTYSQRPEHHNAMEPHGGVAVWNDDGSLTVYSGTQGTVQHATEIAAALEIEPGQVRVVSPYVGGAFGGKAVTWAPTVLAAAAAREVGRPVKLMLTRQQLFPVTGHRPASVQTIELGAARDGTLRALKHETVSSMSTTGVYYTHGGRYSLDAYAVPNLHAGTRVVTLDVPPSTIMRGPIEEPASFALECALDELAYELGVDPVDVRVLNDAQQHPVSGLPYSSKHLRECLETGAERFGWAERPPEPGTRIEGEWRYGMGMAAGLLPALRWDASMRVAFQRAGQVAVGSATTDPGTGMWTLLAVLTSQRLGIPIESVAPELGISSLSPQPAPRGDALGAVASSATVSSGPAVVAACDAAVQALIQHAVEAAGSPFQGQAPQDVQFANGNLVANGRQVGFAELLDVTATGTVEARATSRPGQETRQYAAASFAAHFCEVRVNLYTAEPQVVRMTTVVDAGRVLNPITARNQIAGGVVWGLSQALMEGADVEPATGRIANANFGDYLIPVNADVPDIDVLFLDYPDTIINPVGCRGLGEVGTVGSAAAIANAVFNATGVRVRDLPITPDKLLTE